VIAAPLSPDQPAGPSDEELLAALAQASGRVPEALRSRVHDAFAPFARPQDDEAECAPAPGADQ